LAEGFPFGNDTDVDYEAFNAISYSGHFPWITRVSAGLFAQIAK
jgi:hypothetical protein